MAAKHISRVYVDSRFALPSGEFEIPGEEVQLGQDARCWLGEVSCVNSWDTIDDTNCLFYMRERASTSVAVDRIIALTKGPADVDSLALDLQTKLNGSGKSTGIGTYSVTRASTGSGASGSVNRAYQVTLTGGGSFLIFDDSTIEYYSGVDDAQSTNKLFQFPSGEVFATSHTSTFVDIRRVHSIYIHALGFGGYNCVGPRGERTILAKIPVTAAYGSLLVWTGSHGDHDYIECGVRSIKTLKLELRDARGNLLDLKGTSWSATLIFDR